MRIWYDTEFLEDGHTIELISIAMLAEDDRELYLISEEIEADPLNEQIRGHNWLMQNVIPHLPLRIRHDGKPDISMPGPENSYPRRLGHFHLDETDNRIAPRRFIRNAVRDFIRETPDPQLWAWYGAYDHVVYAQLFGRMIDLPEGFPMHTNDLKQEVERRGNPELPTLNRAEHDALSDAHDLRYRHLWLNGRAV